MSDAQTYRTKDEVKEYQKADPIEKVIDTLKKNKWIDDAEIEKMEEKIKELVNESVKFAEESPYPEPSELYNDVYMEPNYPFISE
jgi:pyruvate dehydrogenase E1 component alpha subunit